MKKILITGASSFLGSGLTLALKDTYEVVVLEHKKPLGFMGQKIMGSMENVNIWEKNLAGVDIVLHMAGVTHSRDPEKYFKINSDGTRDLVLTARKHNVKQFIYISTRAIGACCGAYGESKELGEKYIKESGVPYTILRISEAYNDNFSGPEGMNRFIKAVRKAPGVMFTTPRTLKCFAPIHIDDISRTIIASIENPKSLGTTYTLAGPEELSMPEVAERVLTQNNGTYRALFQVERYAVGVAGKLQHFLCLALFQAAHPGNAITHFDHRTDFLNINRFFKRGDVLFELLNDGVRGHTLRISKI